MEKIMKSTALAAAIMLAAGWHHDASAQEVDKDGCWEAYDCVTVATEWDGDNFIARYTNVCGLSVYLKACNQSAYLASGMSCGAFSLPPGETKAWHLYSGNEPTGRYAWAWVGSSRSSMDFVCSKKWGLNKWKPDW